MSEQYIIANKDEFTGVAEAIRTKGNTTNTLNWPNGFIDAISAIETGSTTTPDDYSLEAKVVNSLSPTTSQIITPSSGYYGLSQVTVPAIPTNYADTSSVTATADEVLAGKIIVGANREVITGTMVNKGTLNKTITLDNNVNTTYTLNQGAGYYDGINITAKGQTKTVDASLTENINITPSSGYLLTGVTVNKPSLTATTATADNVLTGKNFYSSAGTLTAGTMVNNGAVSATLNEDTTSYTIPAGYHNGSGVVNYGGKKLYTRQGTNSTMPLYFSSTNGLALIAFTGLTTDAISDITQVINLSYTFSYEVNGVAYYGSIGGVNTISGTQMTAGYGAYNGVSGYYSSPVFVPISLTTAMDQTLGIKISNVYLPLGLNSNQTPTALTVQYHRIDILV